MNFSAFFVLAVTLLSVVFAQEQSNDNANKTYEVINQSAQENQDADIFVDATLTLKHGYTRGTNFIEQSEQTLVDGIYEAGQTFDGPQAAREIIQKAIKSANKDIAQAVPQYFQCLGEALALSHNGAEQGLREASVLLQKGGLGILDQLQLAQNLFNSGIDAQESAAEILIEAFRMTVESGYTAFYHSTQKSIRIAEKALKDAKQAGPDAQKIQDTNCGAAEKDKQGSDAVNEINESANYANQRGANSQLVEDFQKTVICALGDIIVETDKGKDTVHNLKPLAESDPKAAIEKYYNTINGVKEVVHKTTAQIFLAIGNAAIKSGNQSTAEIQEAFGALEQGKVDIIKAVDAAGGVLETGLKYKGETPSDTVDAVAKIGFHAKLAFVQGCVKAAKLVLSVI